ncbi:MAG: transposase [Lachnospiraceae bacterium]|nr:transposase [Lachnospiraceae bacterium]
MYCKFFFVISGFLIICDFQSTRKTDHPKTFLKDYSGAVVTVGYQVYHSLAKHGLDLRVLLTHTAFHFIFALIFKSNSP